jgi:hypothetical protein
MIHFIVRVTSRTEGVYVRCAPGVSESEAASTNPVLAKCLKSPDDHRIIHSGTYCDPAQG